MEQWDPTTQCHKIYRKRWGQILQSSAAKKIDGNNTVITNGLREWTVSKARFYDEFLVTACQERLLIAPARSADGVDMDVLPTISKDHTSPSDNVFELNKPEYALAITSDNSSIAIVSKRVSLFSWDQRLLWTYDFTEDMEYLHGYIGVCLTSSWVMVIVWKHYFTRVSVLKRQDGSVIEKVDLFPDSDQAAAGGEISGPVTSADGKFVLYMDPCGNIYAFSHDLVYTWKLPDEISNSQGVITFCGESIERLRLAIISSDLATTRLERKELQIEAKTQKWSDIRSKTTTE